MESEIKVRSGSERVLRGRAMEMLLPPWLPPSCCLCGASGPDRGRRGPGAWEEAIAQLCLAIWGEELLIFQILESHPVMDHSLPPAKTLSNNSGWEPKTLHFTLWFDLNRL